MTPMTPETGRMCPFCAEAIKPEARVCPHCRQCLTLWSLRHPVWSLWFTGVPILAIAVVFGLLGLAAIDRLNPEPFYTAALPDSLRVTESRMDWVRSGSEMSIYLTGIITNRSPLAWKHIELECRFFDTNGVMV